jgi:hypothetical protein
MAIVRAKLNRAKFHADAFVSGWDQFCHGGTYAFNMKMDVDPPHALHFWWRIRDRTPEEEKRFTDLSLIYGDILSNLRGTLDYLIWQLVLAVGNQPTERASFPCVKRQADWRSVSGDRLRGVDPRWIGEIEKLQPYHEAEHPERHLLAVLDHNNNANKHRALQAVIVTAQVFNFSYTHPDMPGRNFNFEPWLDRPIEDGTEFFRVTVDPPILNPNIDLVDPPIRISFGDGLDHSDGWDYSNTDLVQWVSDAAAIFEPAFPR